MSPRKTDVEARLNELQATVRGLTQELVDASERIRHLEDALDDESRTERGSPGVFSAAERNGTGKNDGHGGNGGNREYGGSGGGDGGGSRRSTRQKDRDRQADDDADSDLDDIIVA